MARRSGGRGFVAGAFGGGRGRKRPGIGTHGRGRGIQAGAALREDAEASEMRRVMFGEAGVNAMEHGLTLKEAMVARPEIDGNRIYESLLSQIFDEHELFAKTVKSIAKSVSARTEYIRARDQRSLNERNAFRRMTQAETDLKNNVLAEVRKVIRARSEKQ